MANETVTVHPSGVITTSGDYSYSTASNTVNAYTDTNSTTYARMACKTGKNAESFRYFTFDLSSIPENATDITVTAKVKVAVSTSYLPTATAQLTSVKTKKGSATNVRSSSASVKTLTPGSWTRAELNDARLYIYAKRGTSNANRSAYYDLYGADLTVEYTAGNGDRLLFKAGGVWVEAAKVFKKANGVWVEQSDLSTVFDPNTKYRHEN